MKNKIAVIGLGYVGLPLAVEFAKKYKVIGFDINPKRVEELRKGIDETLEIEWFRGRKCNKTNVLAPRKNGNVLQLINIL